VVGCEFGVCCIVKVVGVWFVPRLMVPVSCVVAGRLLNVSVFVVLVFWMLFTFMV